MEHYIQFEIKSKRDIKILQNTIFRLYYQNILVIGRHTLQTKSSYQHATIKGDWNIILTIHCRIFLLFFCFYQRCIPLYAYVQRHIHTYIHSSWWDNNLMINFCVYLLLFCYTFYLSYAILLHTHLILVEWRRTSVWQCPFCGAC